MKVFAGNDENAQFHNPTVTWFISLFLLLAGPPTIPNPETGGCLSEDPT